MRNTKKSKLKKEQNKKVKEELVSIASGAIREIKIKGVKYKVIG